MYALTRLLKGEINNKPKLHLMVSLFLVSLMQMSGLQARVMPDIWFKREVKSIFLQ